MGLPNGVHHLAVCTADVRTQVEFFTDVLGAELKALYWMHGVEKTFHAFVQLNDSSYIAFVQNDEIARTHGELGVSHAANTSAPSAPGTMQHLALNVESDEQLLAIRDRIRDRGINVYGPMDHGLCRSIYFAGPEGLCLEIATSDEAIDHRVWIDPEVARLAGISDDDLARFTAPAAYRDHGGAIPQPPIDATKPHMSGFPPGVYEMLLGTPDDEFTVRFSYSDPPVTSQADETS
jgi:catechol 2,3-dioxygenase-like lactoylglutathione lyase family enzyme